MNIERNFDKYKHNFIMFKFQLETQNQLTHVCLHRLICFSAYIISVRELLCLLLEYKWLSHIAWAKSALSRPHIASSTLLSSLSETKSDLS